MSFINYLNSHVRTNPTDEMHHACSRKISTTGMYKASSLKGRISCLTRVPLHSIGIVAKPIFYSAAAVGMTGLAIVNLDSSAVKKAASFAGAAVVAPIGQILNVCKAGLGILHPGAYFKKPLQGCQLNIASTEPTTKARPLLQVIAKAISEHDVSTLVINYADQQGIDAGGLNRDFTSKLFRTLSAEYNMQQDIMQSDNLQKKEVAKNIGLFFRMLTRTIDKKSISETPIGDVLHSAYFKGILLFDSHEITSAFANIQPARQFEMLADIATTEENRNLFVTLRALIECKEDTITNSDFTQLLTNLEDTFYFETKKYINNDGNINVVEAKAYIITTALPDYNKTLETLHQMGVGMYTTKKKWQKLQKLGHERLQEHIQGVFNKPLLKERLSFEGDTSREMKKKIKEWIDETNDADLKKWLCAVTGGPSIPKEITLSFEKSDSFKYATCFHKVTIPTGQTPDEVIAEFNKVIENPNAGFNTR